jgi:hypothetical protein
MVSFAWSLKWLTNKKLKNLICLKKIPFMNHFKALGVALAVSA